MVAFIRTITHIQSSYKKGDIDMIPISKIDADLSIYKGKTIILWGTGLFGNKILTILRKFSIEPDFICDNNPLKWGTTFRGVLVISPEELERKFQASLKQQDTPPFLLQLSLEGTNQEAVREQVESVGFPEIISCGECWQMLVYYLKCQRFTASPELLEHQNSIWTEYQGVNQQAMYEYFLLHWEELGVFICMPGKTGDITLMTTFEKNDIPFGQSLFPWRLNQNHLKNKKIKIITAVRDPIARDISALYQCITYVGEVHLDKQLYWNQTNDAQAFFDRITPSSSLEEVAENVYQCGNIRYFDPNDKVFRGNLETWFTAFKENVVDVLQYPFDQEKGYTIVETENYDIFIYQLEKLNKLLPELSDWAGHAIHSLENANMASDRWIAESYEKAKKELKFSQDYFDTCYSDPYVTHFYSEKEIEGFKNKWKRNIAEKKED